MNKGCQRWLYQDETDDIPWALSVQVDQVSKQVTSVYVDVYSDDIDNDQHLIEIPVFETQSSAEAANHVCSALLDMGLSVSNRDYELLEKELSQIIR